MSRGTLRVLGVLLLALTVWALALLGWQLWAGGLPSLSFVPSAAPAGGGAPPAVGGPTRHATVTEILATEYLRLDDDTVLTLAAIRAPAPGEPLAAEGRQATSALVRGQRIAWQGDVTAAYIYLPEGQLLQELLLAGGYVRLSDPLPAGALADTLLPALAAAEQAARDGSVGIWSEVAHATVTIATIEPVVCEPGLIPDGAIRPEEAVDFVGAETTVVFLPPRSTSTNQTITLLAGLDEEQFGVTIPAGLASTRPNIDLLYLNHCLAATGRIERGPGGAPRITLRTWDQLLVLR